MTQVAGQDVLLEVDDSGEGLPAVLFVHSLAGRIGFWKPVLHHVRKRHRAVAYDQRGHGASEHGPGAHWTLDDFARDVLRMQLQRCPELFVCNLLRLLHDDVRFCRLRGHLDQRRPGMHRGDPGQSDEHQRSRFDHGEPL